MNYARAVFYVAYNQLLQFLAQTMNAWSIYQ